MDTESSTVVARRNRVKKMGVEVNIITYNESGGWSRGKMRLLGGVIAPVDEKARSAPRSHGVERALSEPSPLGDQTLRLPSAAR